jgi:hypothetical protein
VSKLIVLDKNEAFRMQAIDIPGFAVSETDDTNYLLNFEGHGNRQIFITLKKNILLKLYADMKKQFDHARIDK